MNRYGILITGDPNTGKSSYCNLLNEKKFTINNRELNIIEMTCEENTDIKIDFCFIMDSIDNPNYGRNIVLHLTKIIKLYGKIPIILICNKMDSNDENFKEKFVVNMSIKNNVGIELPIIYLTSMSMMAQNKIEKIETNNI